MMKSSLKIGTNNRNAPLPPPSKSFPSCVVCLRGRLIRKESEGKVKIHGIWSTGLNLIEADSKNKRGYCHQFKYVHKSETTSDEKISGSGRYSGWFDTIDDKRIKRRIKEKHFNLKFVENNAGFYNIEGDGSNVFGYYVVTGTLTQDNVLTIFRHFQPTKAPNTPPKVALTNHLRPLNHQKLRLKKLNSSNILDDNNNGTSAHFKRLVEPVAQNQNKNAISVAKVELSIHKRPSSKRPLSDHKHQRKKLKVTENLIDPIVQTKEPKAPIKKVVAVISPEHRPLNCLLSPKRLSPKIKLAEEEAEEERRRAARDAVQKELNYPQTVFFYDEYNSLKEVGFLHLDCNVKEQEDRERERESKQHPENKPHSYQWKKKKTTETEKSKLEYQRLKLKYRRIVCRVAMLRITKEIRESWIDYVAATNEDSH